MMIEQEQLDLQQTKMLSKLSVLELPGLEKLQLDKLLFNVTSFSIQAKSYQSVRYIVKKLISNTFYFNSNIKKSKLLLITYDYKRKDHTDAWNVIKNLFGMYDEICVGEESFCKKQLCSFKRIFTSLKRWIIYVNRLKTVGLLKERGILAASLVELQRAREKIVSLSIEKQVVLIFFDGGSLENLMIQELKLRGCITITMQHGQPVFHGLNTDRINQTMILNFTSHYIIVTGDYSKKQFLLGGLKETQIKVLGSLKKMKSYKETKTRKFTIFLDCPTYINAYNDNCFMIEIAQRIAEKMNMQYMVKLHPQDTMSRYMHLTLKRGYIIEISSTMEEALNQAEFCILHASGVYLDILSYGKKSFCLKTAINFPLVERELDLFEDINELKSKISIWNSTSNGEKEQYINELVDYYLKPQNALEKHKLFIEKLINDMLYF